MLSVCALPACAKTPPEAQSAPAATPEAAPAGGGAAGQDTTPPPGLDISRLDEFQKKVFFRIVNSEPSICGQAQSLLQSAKKDPNCRRSLQRRPLRGPPRRAGVHRLGDGGVARPSDTATRETHNLDVSEAPMKGNPAAKVTLVEFADYECPHCKRFQPVLRQILDEFQGRREAVLQALPAAAAHQRAPGGRGGRPRPRSRGSSGRTKRSSGPTRTT